MPTAKPAATATNPFTLGREHAAAGVPADRCPWPLHSQKWVRYMNGRQSPAPVQPKPAQPALTAAQEPQ